MWRAKFGGSGVSAATGLASAEDLSAPFNAEIRLPTTSLLWHIAVEKRGAWENIVRMHTGRLNNRRVSLSLDSSV